MPWFQLLEEGNEVCVQLFFFLDFRKAFDSVHVATPMVIYYVWQDSLQLMDYYWFLFKTAAQIDSDSESSQLITWEK